MAARRRPWPMGLAAGLAAVPLACGFQASEINQQIEYVWPLTKFSVPLSPGADYEGEGLEGPPFGAALADIALQRYARYVTDVLPRELEMDAVFKKWFSLADGSRQNLAFLRWQKKVFSKTRGIRPDEIDWDGSPTPDYQGVSYEWPELYAAQDFKRLHKHLVGVAHAFFDEVKKDKSQDRRLRIFVAAEVYHGNDFMKPRSHTGTAFAAKYFAKHMVAGDGAAMRFAIEDPRGAHPPFGKTHWHQPYEGELVMFPGWTNYYMTPAPPNTTTVVFSVLGWPKGGTEDLDWEDDPTGSHVHIKNSKIQRPPEAKTEAAKGHSEL